MYRQTVGEVMRCIYESLALKYRFALGQLEAATGRRFAALHVLGGGAKDGLLCRMTADATGLRTAAGPVEATALGNILIQLVALGMLPSIDAGRRLIAKTERVTEYLPGDTAAWDAAMYGMRTCAARRENRKITKDKGENEMLYPKIGIRPVIDGRWGGVRESLENQTVTMANNAAKLISGRCVTRTASR